MPSLAETLQQEFDSRKLAYPHETLLERYNRRFAEQYAFQESQHPRGQPENAGEFAKTPGKEGTRADRIEGTQAEANNEVRKTKRAVGKARSGLDRATAVKDRPAKLQTQLDAVNKRIAELQAQKAASQQRQAALQGQQSQQQPSAEPGPAQDPSTPPPPGKAYRPNPATTGESRVGVPAFAVPPPPRMEDLLLPNLSPDERRVETQFAQRFTQEPDAMAEEYRRMVYGSSKPKTFETDGAKNLSPDWTQPGQPDDVRKKAQQEWNTALHATANAICKRAFLSHLNDVAKLPEGQRHCLITAGGCAAGKGFALGQVASAKAIQSASAAIWDAAGDQNSAEMPWVLDECTKRGIPCTFMYVHANPDAIWTDPARGVVQRANKEGRMVDARVFADSHTLGAKNFAQFASQAGEKAKFMYLDNSGGPNPSMIAGIPPEVLQRDPEELYRKSLASLETADVSPSVKRGGMAGERIWPDSPRDKFARIFSERGCLHYAFDESKIHRDEEGKFSESANQDGGESVVEKKDPSAMKHETVYRFQPVGLDISNHKSQTSNDDTDIGPHVFGSISEAAGGVSGWMKQPGKWELLEIHADPKDVRDNGDYEGYVLADGRGQIASRKTLGLWKQVLEWAKTQQ